SLANDSRLQAIVDNYVDVVVVPTYASLKDKNALLYQAVVNFKNNPSDANFASACSAWLTAREPWEKSEAFLFGPVDALGLDPNMDSWPLDQDNIVQILNSGNYDNLNWSDGDDDDAIEAVQSVRGFHTLEFLLFKDGQPRKVKN
ncbi:MAG: peptidase M75, partial [Duncaniella sp.]|nr:peptidase M75 [Duncaniella sp.]